jgi:hypothetical protein
MRWKTLDKGESRRIVDEWAAGAIPKPDFYNEYVEMRENLIEIDRITIEELSTRDDKRTKDYDYDLLFGLNMYELLCSKYNFTPRLAADDGIWRYLSIRVVPDIVIRRWGINEGRLWKESRRIWLKTMWWYIYLSWQGDVKSTHEILKGNTTDEIVQLVERVGPGGYRVNLTRKLMQLYGRMSDDQKKRGNLLFRRIMKLNTAKVKVVEPSLYEGGVESYVRELFDNLGVQK